LKSELFDGTEPTINLGKLLCGSEGTLAFTTEVTLKVDALPPSNHGGGIFIVFRKF
jgi:FAD/FMN-containing dehydrogenase